MLQRMESYLAFVRNGGRGRSGWRSTYWLDTRASLGCISKGIDRFTLQRSLHKEVRRSNGEKHNWKQQQKGKWWKEVESCIRQAGRCSVCRKSPQLCCVKWTQESQNEIRSTGKLFRWLVGRLLKSRAATKERKETGEVIEFTWWGDRSTGYVSFIKVSSQISPSDYGTNSAALYQERQNMMTEQIRGEMTKPSFESCNLRGPLKFQGQRLTRQ